MMIEETYIDLAWEVLGLIDDQAQLTEYSDETAQKLAQKLKTDIRVIVDEGFCADCDYYRRCNP